MRREESRKWIKSVDYRYLYNLLYTKIKPSLLFLKKKMKASPKTPKKKRFNNFLPSRGSKRAEFSTKRSSRRNYGDKSDDGSLSLASSTDLMVYPSYTTSDCSVSSISTVASFSHGHTAGIVCPSPSRSVSSETSSKRLALVALERESESSIFRSDEEELLPQVGRQNLDWEVLKDEIRSALDSPLESTLSEFRSVFDTPLSDVYVFRRPVGREFHFSSDSSTDKSKERSIQAEKRQGNHVAQSEKNRKVSASSREKPPMDSDDDVQVNGEVRMKILLLSSSRRVFELVSVACSAQTIVKDIVEDIIPAKATKTYFREQKYVGLCRAFDDASEKEQQLEEFDNSLPIDVYSIRKGETIIAIPASQDDESKSWSASGCVDMSNAILRRTKHGKTVKSLRNSFSQCIQSETLTYLADRNNSKGTSVGRTSKLAFFAWNAGWYCAQAIFAGCALVLAVAVFMEHLKLVAPLKPGDTMHQGEIRSRCGLIGSLTPKGIMTCDPAIVELRSDGVLAFYHGEVKDLIWEIKPVQAVNKVRHAFDLLIWGKSNSLESASPKSLASLHVDFTGAITINGMETELKVYANNDEISLSPWPFVVDPISS